MALLQFFGVTSMPGSPIADAVYIVNSGGPDAEVVVASSAGVLKRWGNTAMIQAVVTAMDLTGADGSSVEMQNSGSYIQWRLVGASTWINLVALSAITGPPGAAGGSSEAVNIKDLGVVGNGTNEGPAFLAALATAAGRELLLENITISMRSIIKAGGANVRIRAVNSKILMLANSGGGYSSNFWYMSGSKISIDGLEWDMQGAPGDEVSGTWIMYMDSCSKVDIRNCYAHDNGHAAFSTVNCGDVTFDHNEIATTDSCIFLRGTTGQAKITRNYMHGGTSEGAGVFNTDMSSSNLPKKYIITDNIVDSKEGFAFNLCASIHGITSNNHCTNCRGLTNYYDSGSGEPATRYSTKAVATDNLVHDCEYGISNIGSYSKIDSNSFVGIQRFAIGTNNYFDTEGGTDGTPTEGVDITNNHFHDICLLTEAQSGPAIWLYNLKNSTFANNNVYGNALAYQGLKIENCGDDLKIHNNNMKPLKIYPAGGSLDFTKKIDFFNCVFRNSDLVPTNPWTSGTEFGWKFDRVTFSESNLSGGFENLTVTSNVLKDINNNMIKVRNYVSNGVVINNIARSWNNRIIILQAPNSASFTINNGGNIALNASSYTISSGDSIILQYDFVFNKWRQCCISQFGAA